MKNLIQITALCALLLGLPSCFYDHPPELVPFDCAEVSFVTHIQPILDARCATSGCHDGNIPPTLTAEVSYNTLVGGGFVNTQLPDESFLLKTVRFEESPMPPGGPKISQLDIELIRCWISEDVPNN